MNKVYIYCDGGLSNRLGSLVSGICLSARLKIGYEVIWPKTNYCDCDFKKLFDIDVECNLVTDNLEVYFEKFDIGVLLTHTQINCPDYVEIFDSNTEEHYLQDFQKNIFYNNSRVANFLTQQEVLKSLDKIKINDLIREIVDSFVIENNIDENTIGLHVRKTDFYFIHSDDFYGEMVSKCLPKKVFVCSDDENSENYLKKTHENVIVRKKNKYPQKIHDGDWREGDISNINRNSDSVVDGLIDMLILSRTTIHDFDIQSSFYKFAKIFNKLNNEKKGLPVSTNLETLTFEENLEKYLKKYSPVHGIIQIGVNIAQEVPIFEKYTKNIILVEPLPYCQEILRDRYPQYLKIPYAIGTEEGVKKFHIASNGGASSSLLKPILHQEFYPDVVFFTDLDVNVKKFVSVIEEYHIDMEKFNILMVDAQGSDLDCIKSFESYLKNFDLIICEIMDVEFYEKNPNLIQYVSYLLEFDFELLELFEYDGKTGNCFFVKKSIE